MSVLLCKSGSISHGFASPVCELHVGSHDFVLVMLIVAKFELCETRTDIESQKSKIYDMGSKVM